jgi:two-component system, OmpR family, response regulator
VSIRKIQSVLYVDDDPNICEVVQATLHLIAGLNVHTAYSGERAIDLAYELRPDIILLDVVMPGLDGPATLKRMREHALLANIPIIFLSAKVCPAEIARFLQLGAIGVIGKPFDPLRLGDELFAIQREVGAGRGLDTTIAGRSHAQDQEDSLAESFLMRTRGDVVRLRAIIERARQEDRSVLEEAERIAHSIHGSGAMFGFLDVSAAGGAIERLVEGITSSTTASSSACDPLLLQQLSDFTNRLAQYVDAGKRAELQ